MTLVNLPGKTATEVIVPTCASASVVPDKVRGVRAKRADLAMRLGTQFRSFRIEEDRIGHLAQHIGFAHMINKPNPLAMPRAAIF